MKNVVTALVLKNGKIFMQKNSEEEPYYAGKWVFPSNHVKDDEKIFEALKKGLKEALGISIKHGLQCSTMADIDPTSGRGFLHHIFIIKGWKGEIKTTKESAWFSKEEIKGIDTFPITFLMLRCLK